MITQAVLVCKLKEFLQKLSDEDYAGCKKIAQLFNNSLKRQWGNLALKCIENVCNYQKQNKKAKQQNKKLLQLIKKRNQKIDEMDNLINLKKQTVQNQEKLTIFDNLQAELYQIAHKQSNKQYNFIHHLKEYDCLKKIWEKIDDGMQIVEPVWKSEFYKDVKKTLFENIKKQQEFEKYTQKIFEGERLQLKEQPKYLSKRFYNILINFERHFVIYREAYRFCQRKQKSYYPQMQIFKQIYQQILEKQFHSQNLDNISLSNHLQAFRKQLKCWKQNNLQQKSMKKCQVLEKQRFISKRSNLEKQMKPIQKKILSIINNQICIDIQLIYPCNQQDFQECLNCLSNNTLKLLQCLNQSKKQSEQYKRKQKQLERKFKNKQQQEKNDKKIKQIKMEQQKKMKEQISILSSNLQKSLKQNEKYKEQIHQLQKKHETITKEFKMMEAQLKQKNRNKTFQKFNHFENRSEKQSRNLSQSKNHKLFISEFDKNQSNKNIITKQFPKKTRQQELKNKQIQHQKQRYSKLLNQYKNLQNQFNCTQNKLIDFYQKELNMINQMQRKDVLKNQMQRKDVQRLKMRNKILQYQQQMEYLKCKIIHLETLNNKYKKNKKIKRQSQLHLEQQIEQERIRYKQLFQRKFASKMSMQSTDKY